MSIKSSLTDVVIAIGDNSPFFERCMSGVQLQNEAIANVFLVLNHTAELEYYTKMVSCLDPTIVAKCRIIDALGASNANIARNIGFLKSKNKYVAYLDVDDLWHENHIQASTQNIECSDTIGCYSGMHVCSSENKFTKVATNYLAEPNMQTYLVKKQPAPTSSLVVDREKTENILWDWSLKRHQDYDYLSRLSQIGQLTYKTDVTLSYFVHNQNPNRTFADALVLLENWKCDIPEKYFNEHRNYILKKMVKNFEFRELISWLFR